MTLQDNLVVNAIAWVFIHLTIGYLSTKIPISQLDPLARLYRSRNWEREGEIYQRLFHVRRWKHLAPSGARIYGTYSVKHLHDFSRPDLERWLRESCRAEACHWLMIPPGLLFFLWNSVYIAIAMVLYAVLNNVIPIVLQRYNRPRVQRLIGKLESKQVQSLRDAGLLDRQVAPAGGR